MIVNERWHSLIIAGDILRFKLKNERLLNILTEFHSNKIHDYVGKVSSTANQDRVTTFINFHPHLTQVPTRHRSFKLVFEPLRYCRAKAISQECTPQNR